jgi:hypothetical protein
MKKFPMLLIPALALIPVLAVSQPGDVFGTKTLTDNALGQQQVERLWADFAQPDLAALDKFVAPGFQSLHEDGARDWPQERLMVAELKITPYVLSNYKVTRNGDLLLVTYQCQVGETIAAAQLAKESSPRLDVFQQTLGEWKLLAHVNVRKIEPGAKPGTLPMMIAARD